MRAACPFAATPEPLRSELNPEAHLHHHGKDRRLPVEPSHSGACTAERLYSKLVQNSIGQHARFPAQHPVLPGQQRRGSEGDPLTGLPSFPQGKTANFHGKSTKDDAMGEITKHIATG